VRHLLSTHGSATAQWTRCTAGASVIGDVFPAGGHSWFRLIGALAGDKLMLTFFARHTLRPLQGRWTPGSGATVPQLTAEHIAVRSIRVFRLPEPGAEPFDITAGPDGSMWFTEYAADKIGRIAQDGAITQFTVPTSGAGPYQITTGPGGAIFFTEYNTTKIGRVSQQGKVTEIPIPRPTFGGTEITGPMTETGPVLAADPAGYIDSLSASGTISRTKVPPEFGLPFAIARLGNGVIWLSELTGYYEYSRHLLSFVSGSGKPSRTITLPNPLSDIVALAPGPASSVWFADFGTTNAGEIGPGGEVSLFPVGPPYAGISDIAPGPADSMWISEQDGIIARVTPGGHVSQLALPSPGCNPDGIAAGHGNSIWVTETGTDAIAEINLAQRG